MPPIGATNQLKDLAGAISQSTGKPVYTDPYGLNATNTPGSSSNNAPYQPASSVTNIMYPQQPIAHAAYYNSGQAYQTALGQAHGTVDPLYNKMINDFNAQMDAQVQNYNQQNQLANTGIENTLQNLLQNNQITGQRVGEDTSTALSNLANYQGNYKETEGMGFDQAQRALQGNLGAAGTATSGLGQQQVGAAQRQERLGQEAQGQQYQTQRVAQQLFMNRSLEDLSRSSAQAGTSAGLQKQGAQLSLNQQLTQSAMAREQGLQSYQQQQNAALQSQAAANYGLGLSDWLKGQQKVLNPYDFTATLQANPVRF